MISRSKVDSGSINALHRLGDEKEFAMERLLTSDIKIGNESLELGLELQMDNLRMDQPGPSAIHRDPWAKGMEGLWTKAPDGPFSSFSFRFLRTTNLFMPGQHVIDMNKEIGPKLPKDLVLISDITKA